MLLFLRWRIYFIASYISGIGYFSRRKESKIMNISMIIDGLAMALFALAAVHLPEIIVYLDYLININLGE
tara:strand:+ start:21 stop:230 length:210 start_codon:yes stop_codon:yes gene_type:complete